MAGTGWGSGIGAVAGGVGGGIVGGPLGAAAGATVGGWLGGKAEGAMARGAKTVTMLNPDNPYYQYGGTRWVEDPNEPGGGHWVSGADDRADQYNELGSFYANRDDTRIDYAQADADREQQLALAQQYQDVIDGKAPSVAQLQMQRGLDEATQQSLQMAASARGGGALLAQQQAGQAGALARQQAIGDSSTLRAQETAAARDSKGQLLGQTAAQSAGRAEAQAQTQLQSEQQRYGQGFSYRQQADTIRQGQRDANIGVVQGNQTAKVALATGQQQAAAAQRAAIIQGGASLVGSGLAAYAGSSGGKK